MTADYERTSGSGPTVFAPPLIRGRIFAQRVAADVDHTGVRMLEARSLVPVEPSIAE